MKNSKIEWCDHTQNFWVGCSPVSEGCQNCYARRQVNRFGGDFSERRRTSAANWKLPARWNRQRELLEDSKDGCYGYRLPANPRVFCGSMMDWLDDQVPVAWLADALRVMRETRNLTWMLLTKRPENFARGLRRCLDAEASMIWMDECSPPRNIWVGASVENQEMADLRIPQLLAIPAAKRFLSIEPLLGPVQMRTFCDGQGGVPIGLGGSSVVQGKFDWVIVGGESGPGFRPMNLGWLEFLAAQCTAAGIPLFVKQDAGLRPGQQGRIPDKLWARKEFPV